MVSDAYGYRTVAGAVEVLNVAPVIAELRGGTVAEGAPYAESSAFVDPGADLWEATVDYGDGTGVSSLPLTGKAFTLDHVYADNGSYTVTVTVRDDDGGEGTASCTVVVSNQAPSVEAGPDQDVREGEIVFLAPATFHDPATLDTHTASIAWGDDTEATEGVVTESPTGPAGSVLGLDGTVGGSHIYQMPFAHFVGPSGDYTVTVGVTDDDLGTGSDTLVVTVHDVRPPAVTWVSRPSWADNDPQPVFTWQGSDDHTLSSALLYSTRFNGSAWSEFTSATSLQFGPLQEDWYTLEVRAQDQAGNVSSILTWRWLVDLTPPEIDLRVPRENARYVLSEVVLAEWDARDPGSLASGIWRFEPTASGEPIDTRTAGRRPLTVQVWDWAGNTASAQVEYWVMFVLVPATAVGVGGSAEDVLQVGAGLRLLDGEELPALGPAGIYELGDVIRVAFALAGADGERVTDAFVSATLVGVGEPDGGRPRLIGLWAVEYDSDLALYSLSIPTATAEGTLPPGDYEIWIGLGDASSVGLRIQLQGPAE
jgi:PKD repeat protein